MYEGYGQTETTAGTSLTEYGDWTFNHVGGPFPCNEVKLIDVPELEYYSRGSYPCGEILIRGPNCFVGYYKDPEKTAETIDEDGWVHSGDIGMWDEQGRLRIIDRKKNIFKLSQGEYVVPEKIEIIIAKNSFVDQVFVHGDPLKSFVVAVIVPNAEQVCTWANKTLETSENDPQLALEKVNTDHRKELEELIRGEVTKHARSTKLLRGFEIPKDVYISIEPFSPENDLLTPSYKLKRNVAAKRFEEQIKNLYSRFEE